MFTPASFTLPSPPALARLSPRLRRLALVCGGLLVAGSAGAAITVTGPTSPGIPPQGVGQDYDAPAELVIGSAAGPAIVTVDRTSRLSGESVTVGDVAGSIGQVSVSDRGSSLVGRSGGLTVGRFGDGWVTAGSGASLDFSGTVVLGEQATGIGRLEVSDPGTVLIASGGLLAGSSGTGDVEFANGAFASFGGQIQIGEVSPTSLGVATVRGIGTRLSGASSLLIGGGGTGELAVLDGAITSVSNAVALGSGFGAGIVRVEGAGSRLLGGTDLIAGARGTGRLEVADGGLASFTQNIALGTTGDGFVSVRGPGSRLASNGRLAVGLSGRGELQVQDGALVTLGDDLDIAAGFGGTGAILIDGAGSRLSTIRSVSVGGAGYGELDITGGGSLQSNTGFDIATSGSPGRVSVAGVRSRLDVGLGGLRIGSIRGQTTSDAGGTLSISDQAVVDASAAQAPVFVAEDGRVEMREGLLFTNGLNVSGALSGGGEVFGAVSISQTGRVEVPTGQRLRFRTTSETLASGDILLPGGSLELTGDLTHDTGDIVVRDGAVLDTDGLTSSGDFLALSGVSNVFGDTDLSAGKIVVAPETVLVFHDTLVQGAADVIQGTLIADFLMMMPATEMLLGLGRPNEGAPVVVGGGASLSGELEVRLPEEVALTAGIGDVFPLIEAGSLAGSFTGYDLPTLSGGRWLTPIQDSGLLSLEVVGALPADFNLDGTVDAADYSMLRDGMGSIYDESDRLAWRAYYGTTLGAPATAVPEPATAVAALLGVLGAVGFRRAA